MSHKSEAMWGTDNAVRVKDVVAVKECKKLNGRWAFEYVVKESGKWSWYKNTEQECKADRAKLVSLIDAQDNPKADTLEPIKRYCRKNEDTIIPVLGILAFDHLFNGGGGRKRLVDSLKRLLGKPKA